METNRTEQHTTRVHIRWMIRRDMPEIFQIEQQSFELAWTEENFLSQLRQINCIGMIAETEMVRHERYQEPVIVGFMIYELLKKELKLLNFAVHPAWRYQGIGGKMVAKLVSKLSNQGRDSITFEVRETNLPAQLFFSKKGFKATKVLQSWYEDSGEDAFLMQYRLPDLSEPDT